MTEDDLSKPHSTYSNLINSHVLVLQVMGTPEPKIAEINAMIPDPTWLDSYIQDRIFANPEGWDSYVGNPQGTARAGLQSAGMQLPAAGTTPMASDSQIGATNGQLDVPESSGIFGPNMETGPGTEAEGTVKGMVWAGLGLGAGLIGWKFLKGRGGSLGGIMGGGDDAARAARSLMGGGGAAGVGVSGGGAGVAPQLSLVDDLVGPGMGRNITSRLGDELLQSASTHGTRRGAVMSVLGERGGEEAATVHSILSGTGPAHGLTTQANLLAMNANIPFDDAMQAILRSESSSTFRDIVRTRQLGDLAASIVAARQPAAGVGGGAAPITNDALESILAGLGKVAQSPPA
jgi:hypothetical protein